MHVHQILLRLVHIASGVYWAGTIFFFSTFLEPSLRTLGPDGGKVMVKLFERGYLTVLPVVALATVVSGWWLLWIASGGFDAAYMGSSTGIALSTGGLLATIAFLVGLFGVRPTAVRIWAISREMPQVADDGRRNALMADMTRQRDRIGKAARIVFVLLALAVSLMAVGRYA